MFPRKPISHPAVRTLLVLIPMLFAAVPRAGQAAPPPRPAPPGETVVHGERAVLAGSAVVNFTEAARREAQRLGARPPVRPLLRREFDEEEGEEPGAGIVGAPAATLSSPFAVQSIQLASPPPTSSFMGLDDIPMVDSSYIIIPPDVDGAVGPTRILEGLNNNYRILDKATGATISTVGTATFWSPVAPANELNQLTDPRTTYDPYNNRWIVEMQTVNVNGDILVGVSQTGDPAGAWFLYRFTGFVASNYLIDFPILGFNKNWIAVTINRYTAPAGAFSRGICLAIDYPLARTGTGSATLFTQASGTHFCTAPAVTCSATEDTLFLITHLSSGSGTFQVDRITGTSALPTYTSGGAITRPGGGWVQPSGQLLPQSAPNSGTSSCSPSPPCPVETQDAQVRSSPIYRNGFLYYTQTIGLPSSGLTHTGVQWTKVTPSTTPAFVDGGRLEDATATATNGGKWYAYPSIAVNSQNDFMIGFSQFSSVDHPAAGYAFHFGTDGAGTLRDPLVFKAGEDYYHKDFGSGRNRWGDFSTTQVDPDDATLWTVQEYAKNRVSTDDGTTGSNGSRWSTWWAAVGTPATFYSLSLTSLGVGSVAKSPDQASYLSGTVVQLTATPGTGFSFTSWSGAAAGAANPLNVTMDADKAISAHFADTAPPSVTVLALNGGETVPIGSTQTLQWSATDNQVVAHVDLMLSRNGPGGPFEPIAGDVPNTGSFDWLVTGPETSDAYFSVTARDSADNGEADLSNAAFAIVSSAAVGDAPVTALELAPISPNPLRHSGVITFALPQRGRVRLTVHDVLGREAAVLADGIYDAGRHHLTWNGAREPDGLYFVRLDAGGRTLMRRAAVLR